MTALALRLLAAMVLLGLLIRGVIGVELLRDPGVGWGELLVALLLGVYHDLWAFVLVACPLALVSWLVPRALHPVLFVVCATLCIVTFAEVFFWWEFASRLNRLVFHYLLFPREVLVFLEDQFYVSLYVLPASAVVYGVYRVLRGARSRPRTSARAALGVTALAGVCVAWVLPFEFSAQRRINEMASNGYLSVLRAATTDPRRWHDVYWQPASGAAVAAAAAPPDQPPVPTLSVKHVVLVIEESFGGRVWRNPEDRARYLPEFSKLMRRGWYFSQLYATGSRTTRGLEAVLNGFPPLPGIAVTQRPGYGRLPSLARALNDAGFYSIFVYGGWPNFSNFSAYWQAAGYQAQTSRNDFAQPGFETSWGVADEDLFGRVRDEMRHLTQQHARVFLTTLTVSHHRPFDFPAGRVDFPAAERRSEYALAYADWALGDFLTRAAAEPWFADTLFVVVADHGPRIYGNGPIPIDGYRVPMVFFAPAHLTPRTIDHLGSSMSLGVTLLNLLGLKNTEGLFGSDLLRYSAGVTPVEYDYHVGMVTPSGLTVLHRGGSVSGWTHTEDGLVETDADLSVAAQTAALFGGAHGWFYRAEKLAAH